MLLHFVIPDLIRNLDLRFREDDSYASMSFSTDSINSLPLARSRIYFSDSRFRGNDGEGGNDIRYRT